MSLLLLSLALAAPSRAQASWLDNCAKLFGIASPAPAKREIRSETTRRQKILVSGARGPAEPGLRATIEEANQMLTEFRLPPHLAIDVTGGPQDIHYLPEEFRIVLPSHFAKDFSREAEATKRAFLQHEYGHAVFDENFSSYSTEWQNWLVDAKDRGGLFASENPAPLPHILQNLSEPYQELFADLLTAATHGDPQAISRPLHAFADGSDPRVQMRDFSGNVFGARWNEPEVVTGEFGPIYGANPLDYPPEKLKKLSDDHLAFAPVRSYLWENYFSRPDLAARKPKLMKAVFDTIAKEILARQADPKLNRISFAESSARLLRALDLSLAEYKLK